MLFFFGVGVKSIKSLTFGYFNHYNAKICKCQLFVRLYCTFAQYFLYKSTKLCIKNLCNSYKHTQHKKNS